MKLKLLQLKCTTKLRSFKLLYKIEEILLFQAFRKFVFVFQSIVKVFLNKNDNIEMTRFDWKLANFLRLYIANDFLNYWKINLFKSKTKYITLNPLKLKESSKKELWKLYFVHKTVQIHCVFFSWTATKITLPNNFTHLLSGRLLK